MHHEVRSVNRLTTDPFRLALSSYQTAAALHAQSLPGRMFHMSPVKRNEAIQLLLSFKASSSFFIACLNVYIILCIIMSCLQKQALQSKTQLMHRDAP